VRVIVGGLSCSYRIWERGILFRSPDWLGFNWSIWPLGQWQEVLQISGGSEEVRGWRVWRLLILIYTRGSFCRWQRTWLLSQLVQVETFVQIHVGTMRKLRGVFHNGGVLEWDNFLCVFRPPFHVVSPQMRFGSFVARKTRSMVVGVRVGRSLLTLHSITACLMSRDRSVSVIVYLPAVCLFMQPLDLEVYSLQYLWTKIVFNAVTKRIHGGGGGLQT